MAAVVEDERKTEIERKEPEDKTSVPEECKFGSNPEDDDSGANGEDEHRLAYEALDAEAVLKQLVDRKCRIENDVSRFDLKSTLEVCM